MHTTEARGGGEGGGRGRRLAQLGEFGLIDLLSRGAPAGEGVVTGIGDDAAVVRASPGVEWLLTCDLLHEGVHFRRRWYEAEPWRLGHKALAVNLSDVAAKGGRPRYCLVTLGAGARVQPDFLREVYDGMYCLARRWGVSVVGGDTVALTDPEGMLLDLFLVGEVPAGRALLRSAARPGDLIAVTGRFGLARAGLALLEEAGPAAAEPGDWWEARCRQLGATVRLKEAWAVAGTGLVRCMSDTSDGLADQVHHICRRSGVGAVVEAARVPVGEEVRTVAGRLGADPLRWALWGGEDYELMLTVAPGDLEAVAAAVAAAGGVDLTVVGAITPGPEITLEWPEGRTEPLAFGGWEHFRE